MTKTKKIGSIDRQYEQLYAGTSNPDVKKLIVRKMKAGVEFGKFKAIYDAYMSTNSQKFKKIYKQAMRAC